MRRGSAQRLDGGLWVSGYLDAVLQFVSARVVYIWKGRRDYKC